MRWIDDQKRMLTERRVAPVKSNEFAMTNGGGKPVRSKSGVATMAKPKPDDPAAAPAITTINEPTIN